ncbi:ubiquitin-specific protease 15 [Hibiscus trionum]|uniref:Ubiquitin-specific protease 15 n=1 Tax=Hibiscus trionum TaxID=183268 RepID=A0A9W7MNX5_HIBTR|nr:ubiquitin-specific protease 15 [Hibiscus trionum]
MLEPREADIPALFLFLVVFPLVAYFLLGKWGEVSKKREKISLLAHLVAEEAFRAETMAATDIIPVVPIPERGLHVCARCFGPATTRCSRCKPVRYW